MEPTNDRWRKAILSERENGAVHKPMIRGLSHFEGQKNAALILGDASLVQSKYLLDTAGFARVVDVDSSPTLLDDDIISLDDTRLTRVLLPFDQYEFPVNTFDFVYGKSIAFNPKETIKTVLKNIFDSLNNGGIYAGEYAAEGDSFRNVFYTEEELNQLHMEAGFKIIAIIHPPSIETEGLVRPGTAHTIRVFTKKQ